MSYINYGNTKMYYSFYRQNRKDIRVVIDLINKIVAFVPETMSEDKIHQTLSNKAQWIYTKVQELNEIQSNVSPKEFVSGEKLMYLGRQYRLKVYREVVDKTSFTFRQGRFVAVVPSNWAQEKVQDRLEAHLIEWYRKHGLKKIQERVAYYENILGVRAQSIQMKTQHKRWGTCTPEGNIYINWRIAMAPIKIIDYIVVHELAHLRIPEHSDAFWKLIRSILSDYEGSKEWLRVHGMELYCVGQEKT